MVLSIDRSSWRGAKCFMKFWFSGELDHRISDAYRPVRKRIEARLNALCQNRNYGDLITEIAIIPMILGPEFRSGRKERRLWQRQQKSADYRTIIDFAAFQNGDEAERERLLVENTVDAIRDLQRKAGASFLGELLISEILTEFGSWPEGEKSSPPER